jgi:hypothetical protein
LNDLADIFKTAEEFKIQNPWDEPTNQEQYKIVNPWEGNSGETPNEQSRMQAQEKFEISEDHYVNNHSSQ